MSNRRSNSVAFDNPIPASWTTPEALGIKTIVEPPAEIEERNKARIVPQLHKGEVISHICESCGQRMGNAEGPTKEPHDVVTRVIRPGHSVGGLKSGAVIYVEPQHLAGPIAESTWSVVEWRIHENARAVPPPEKPKSQLQQMVETSLPAVVAQTKEMIRAGKERIHQDMLRAAAEAQSYLGNERPVADSSSNVVQDKILAALDAITKRLEALETKKKK